MKNPPPSDSKHPATWKFAFKSGFVAVDKLVVSTLPPWTWRRWLACLQGAVAAMGFIALPALSASAFTLTNVALPGVAYSSVVCGDFNNDGQPDVLVTGADGAFNGISQVWQNHANGRFTNLNAVLPGVSSSAVARGDFNNDGRLDLLATGEKGCLPGVGPPLLPPA
jgi:hypothetical protein